MNQNIKLFYKQHKISNDYIGEKELKFYIHTTISIFSTKHCNIHSTFTKKTHNAFRILLRKRNEIQHLTSDIFFKQLLSDTKKRTKSTTKIYHNYNTLYFDTNKQFYFVFYILFFYNIDFIYMYTSLSIEYFFRIRYN